MAKRHRHAPEDGLKTAASQASSAASPRPSTKFDVYFDDLEAGLSVKEVAIKHRVSHQAVYYAINRPSDRRKWLRELNVARRPSVTKQGSTILVSLPEVRLVFSPGMARAFSERLSSVLDQRPDDRMIVELYSSGLNQEEVAAELKTTKDVVRGALKRAGIKSRRGMASIKPERRTATIAAAVRGRWGKRARSAEEYREEFDKGLSVSEVAAKLGVTRQAALAAWKRLNRLKIVEG